MTLAWALVCTAMALLLVLDPSPAEDLIWFMPGQIYLLAQVAVLAVAWVAALVVGHRPRTSLVLLPVTVLAPWGFLLYAALPGLLAAWSVVFMHHKRGSSARTGGGATGGVGMGLLCLLMLNACQASKQPTLETSRGTEMIQTASSEYTIRSDDGLLTTEISYTFTNATGARVYLVNCNGAFGLRLDRLDGEEWQEAWSPIQPQCLSAPIIIEPGSTFEGTIDVTAGLPGSDMHPQFDVADPSGTYRIVWTQVLSSFSNNGHPFGPEIPFEARVSNQFRLELG